MTKVTAMDSTNTGATTSDHARILTEVGHMSEEQTINTSAYNISFRSVPFYARFGAVN